MKAILLAGGSGTRLWPLSRNNFPKQFIKLNGDKSLLRQTAERVLGVVSPSDIVVLTNKRYEFYVKEELAFLRGAGNSASGGRKSDAFHLVLEPAARNTAPAIGLAAAYCKEKLGCADDEVLIILPSDHVIRPKEKFEVYLKAAMEIAKEGYLSTFGIKPSRPETGYGYVKTGSPIGKRSSACDYFKAEKFAEKPDAETALRYLKEGSYCWNAGIFAFSIGTIMDELKRWKPEIWTLLQKGFEEACASFDKMPDISIDYAVMEKAENVCVVPMDIYWNDVGSFDAIYEILEGDENGNVHIGDIQSVGCKNSFMIGNGRLIAAIGIENAVIVETGDAVLIAKRDCTQQVKDVVKTLKEKGRKEVEDNLTTYRPWGSYTILEEGSRYKIKRIVVMPRERLSLQKHCHRSEHWVVVKGTAKVTIADREMVIHENESVYVPKSSLHRLENPGRIPVEIIEVQNGEYLGEDDIERFDDVYGRENG